VFERKVQYMKLSVARSELLDALSVVGKGLSARSTLPILSGILLTSANGELQFQATDLEVSVRRTCAALIEQEGQIVVPGKLITEIVRNLPDAAVTIETEGDIAHIRCLHSSFTVKTLNAADFPKFPEVVVEETVSLPSGVISSVVKKVSKSVSRDETRATLTGILVVVEGPSLKMVSTDSYRLAISEVVLEGELESGLNVVIPGRALDEVTRLSSDSEEMRIGLTENQVVFEFGQTVFVTRRIEGNFPNYKQIIPKESATSVEVSGEELVAAVKRVSLMALHNSPIKLQVSVEDQTLSLSAMTQDVGEASEDVMVKAEGVDVGIAFNHSFLMDGLSSAGSETVRIEIKDQEKPGLIRSAVEDGFRYVLMPVRTG
jgi:DNA polymerase III subunit beta